MSEQVFVGTSASAGPSGQAGCRARGRVWRPGGRASGAHLASEDAAHLESGDADVAPLKGI